MLPIHTPVQINCPHSRHHGHSGYIDDVSKGPKSGKNIYSVRVYHDGVRLLQTAVFFDEDLKKIQPTEKPAFENQWNNHEHRN